ncbi:MAG: hypothetical protein KF726_24355 [Anaerolineae bacterium]|nr:hypothetical protein [Anaerolineae bacterium]
MESSTASTPRMSLLEVLDRTFRLYRENLLLYLVITAAVLIPVTLIQAALGVGATSNAALVNSGRLTQAQATQMTTQLCGSAIISLLIALVQNVLLIGVITYISSEKILGRSATIGEAFSAALNRAVPLIIGNVLLWIVLVAILFAGTLVSLACPPIFAALIGLVAYIAVAISGLMTPILLLENVGAVAGINRAWGLGKRRFWTVLGLFFILSVIGLILGAAIGLVAGVLVGTTNLSAYQTVTTISSLLVSIVITPLTPIGQTALYYDTRNRLEGLDLALASSGAAAPRPSDVESPPIPNSLSTQDLINIGIIIGVALLFVLVLQGSTELLLRLIPGAGSLPR